MAIEDPPQAPPERQRPTVADLIAAANAGQVAGASVAVPATLPVTTARVITAPVRAVANVAIDSAKVALALRILRRLFQTSKIDNRGWLEKELARRYPNVDPAIIRAAVERELRLEQSFRAKAQKRVEADVLEASKLPTPEAQKQRIQEIIARESHYIRLRERAMLARATAACENAIVKQKSPLGARWVLGAAKQHTPGCVALAGKAWPWAVLDTVSPPVHAGCKCSLRPLGIGETIPDIGSAMHAARRAMALEEAVREVADPSEIDAYLAGEFVRPVIQRALQRIGNEIFYQGEWLTEAEAEAPPTGTMVALFPSENVAKKLALKGGEPADEIHLTLAFLGKAADLKDPDGLKQAVSDWAARTPPLDGEIAGHGLFTAGPEPVTYVSPDLPGLPAARDDLTDALDGHPISKTHGFTPHMTIAYADRTDDMPDHGGRKLSFDKASLVMAGDRHDFKLAGKLQEASYKEELHPRGRGGEWVSKFFDHPHELVPIDSLTPSKPREPDSIANAKVRMADAAAGKIARRAPISVRPNADGGYTILDGHATYGALQEMGATHIPVQIQHEHGVADSLTPPKSGQVKQVADVVIPAIDRLLAVKPLEKPIPLRAISGKNKKGSYAREIVGGRAVPKEIKLSVSERSHLTLTHEIGHMLDSEHLGTEMEREDGTKIGGNGSLGAAVRADLGSKNITEHPKWQAYLDMPKNQRDAWDGWWQAISQAPEYGHLNSGSFNEMGMLRYLQSPPELFARSFAQWVAAHANDERLTDELNGMRDPSRLALGMKPRENWRAGKATYTARTPDEVPHVLKSRQWSDQSFQPIDQALTSLFKTYGMLSPTTSSPPLTESWILSTQISTTNSAPTLLQEATPYKEALHPRGRGGRWTNILAKLKTAKLDDITDVEGHSVIRTSDGYSVRVGAGKRATGTDPEKIADAIEGHLEHRAGLGEPMTLDNADERYQHWFSPQKLDGERKPHPKSGYELQVGKWRRVIHPERDTDGPPLFQVTDYGEQPGGKMFPDDAGTEPIRELYRGMSTDEWNQAVKRGYIQSDMRGAISDWEGTNAGVDPQTAHSYLPYGQEGVIAKIGVQPEDGWFTRNEDGYLRTRQGIPLSRVSAVSPVLYKDQQEGTFVRPDSTSAAQLTSGANDRSREAQNRSAGGSSGGGRGDLVRLAEVDASTEAGYRRYIAALRANPHSEYVTEPSQEELAAKQVWMNADDNVGVTVAPDGEIGNLFRNPGAPRGAGTVALNHALANGGSWLNCFDGALPGIYAKSGFATVARLKFEPDFKPDGWDLEKQNHPNILFMAHGKPADPGPLLEDWDEAEAKVLAVVLQEATYKEPLHPRDRTGKWMDKLGHEPSAKFGVKLRYDIGDPSDEGAVRRIEARDANGVLVGVVGFTTNGRKTYPDGQYDDVVGLKSLEVHPQARRQGIATKLMDEVQQRFPYHVIDPGSFTNEGAAFWSAHTGENKVGSTEFVRQRDPAEWWEGRTPRALVPVPEPLEEADIYTEALHPRDRLGKWMTKEFGERLAGAKGSTKAGEKPKEYRPAQWVDHGQDLETMAGEAAQLLHPAGTPDEHAAIAQAVAADRPLPREASKQAKAVTTALRKQSTPDGLQGRYIYRLHNIASDLHAGQTDRGGNPYMRHVEAVADSVSDDAKPVALFHDALEDTKLTPEALKAALTEPKVTTPEQAQDMVDAVRLLTHDKAGDRGQPSAEEAGSTLKTVLQSDEAFALLDSYPETEGSDWGAGGCRAAAVAVHDLLPGSTIEVIRRSDSGQAEHFVVQYQGKYLDYDGVSTKSELLDRFAEEQFASRADLSLGPATTADDETVPNPVDAAGVPLSDKLAVLLGAEGTGFSSDYERYIKRIKDAPGKAGELAREVKRADLQHNLGRMTQQIAAENPELASRYNAALKTLAPDYQPITQRGEAKNVGRIVGKNQREPLDEAVVMDRLRKLYAASEDAGTAEVEKHWYSTAHDQIQQLAVEHNIDPHTLAAMVAATSPQMTWKHEYKDGRVRYPNLDLAVHAAELARKYPSEPAPKLVDRLVEESKRRTAEERKQGASELGGLGESMLKAIRIYRGEDPERVLGAPKTRSFANNLTYPDQATTVTSGRAYGPRDPGSRQDELQQVDGRDPR